VADDSEPKEPRLTFSVGLLGATFVPKIIGNLSAGATVQTIGSIRPVSARLPLRQVDVSPAIRRRPGRRSPGYSSLYARRGDVRRAIDASDRAAALSKYHGILFLAARNYIDAGQAAKAQAVAVALGARLDDEPQIHAKLIEGEIAFKQGKAREAVERYLAAQKIGDSWLGHYDLGLAYLEAGQFTEAYGEFEKCLARRGEATAIFLDDIPTYRFFASVHYYLGRAQEGLNSPAAAESYKTFLAIKATGGERGIVEEAKRRVAGR